MGHIRHRIHRSIKPHTTLRYNVFRIWYIPLYSIVIMIKILFCFSQYVRCVVAVEYKLNVFFFTLESNLTIFGSGQDIWLHSRNEGFMVVYGLYLNWPILAAAHF